MVMSLINQLKNAAKKAGLEVVEACSATGHYQITGGAFLVNYYPHSKKQTAYVAGMNKGKTGITPKQAVMLASEVPKKVKRTGKRTMHAEKKRRIKRRMMIKQGGVCCWDKDGGGCLLPGTPMVLEFNGSDDHHATVEHVIPLGRGGLDNNNNIKLAHKKCNQARSNEMPEITGDIK